MLYADLGELDLSESAYRDAISIREEVRKLAPDDRANVVYLGGATCNLANIVARKGDLPRAVQLFDESIAIISGALPPCTCGCQRALAHAVFDAAGQLQWMTLAHQFLDTAETNRQWAMRGDETSD